MEKSKLDCCVVRDLLPAYLEGLTEEGTAELVQGHLAGCPSCQAVRETMAAQVPVEKARRGELNFLKRGRRLRRLSALLAAILVLLGVKWLYGQAFRWTDSEASLGMALEEEVGRIVEGLSHFQVLGTQWDGEELLVLFQAQEVGAAFVRIHQRYLVRAGAVDRLEGGEVVLRDGRRLPVSRSCQQSALLALTRAELEG